MRAERKNITVTNETVWNTLIQSDNASKYIERCILFYLEATEKGYVTLAEFNTAIEIRDRKIEKIITNYTHVIGILDEMCKNLFNK